MLNLKTLFGKKADDEKNVATVQAAPGSHAPGVVGAVAKLFDKNEKEVARLRPMVDRINSFGPDLKAMSDEELKAKSAELKRRFREDVTAMLQKQKDVATGEAFDWRELNTEMEWSDAYVQARRDAEKAVLDELLPEAFALVREAGDRTIGLRHFDVQMIGGAVLHSGRIAEMRTGEGKTLVATLPVYLNALSGRGVHVITTNDYLAERDANWMRPIYEFLGLSVAFLTNDMENEARIPAYNSDVLYATNSEVGFDYLRDNMARTPEDLVQRALNFAIVDEVDNILIDEARTPLIISAQVAKTDRALRRQAMAKTCDGLARKLMPAVTDREIELLQDSLTQKGRIDIDGLMRDIQKRGAFTAATQYLVDAYLVGEDSARIDNAAHLLDVADEFAENGLIDEAGRAHLEAIAVSAVHPEGLRAAWQKEVARLTEPFARAWSNTLSSDLNAPALTAALAADLALSGEAASALALPAPASNETEIEAGATNAVSADAANANGASATNGIGTNAERAIASVVADEMARRGLIDESATDAIVAVLMENGGAVQQATLEGVHLALMEAALQAPGGLSETDALLHAAVGEEASDVQSPAGVRVVIEALEELSLRGLLPFESTEKLWEAVRLTQGRDALRREIREAIEAHPGETARRISELVANYSDERAAFLREQSDVLRGQFSGHEALANRAQSGQSATELRRALLSELSKSGAFGEAMKAAKKFTAEQGRAHQNIAGNLAEEMAQWVEVPRDARKALTALFDEGGRIEEVRERVLLAVRDLPGENTELPALVGEAGRQLQEWRHQAAAKLIGEIEVTLDEQTLTNIGQAIEFGEYPTGFEAFIGEQLMESPDIDTQTEAIDAFGARWDEFRATQNAQLVEAITGLLPLSQDAEESLAELLDQPDVAGAAQAAPLQRALLGLLAGDAVSRHLEPLLTEGNAEAFAEEVKRRVPLAKEMQKRVKAADFAGRSAEQLQRAIVRLVQHSFEVMPFEDFKRVVRNLGWLSEKDEKRRQSALTDMGTLIAEREVGTAAFTDPENFLDTLVSTEIVTEEEAAIVRRAQGETPDESLSAVIDRVLRLPAERRRRLAEAKLQEVQSVLDQAVKAHALFHREVHYLIDAGREIVIVDENTGHKMPGRRYSEGLHEALEAKHGLEVQLESQTVATITIQNYFRLYKKLAGMTGTAKTEEAEFAKTYGIEVVSIPTNKPIQRRDSPDVVYKTAEAKMRAITFEILEHHCAGQPVLVGTRSVEVSEKMSERLKAGPLQTLVLTQLIKSRLWDDKTTPDEQKREIIAGLQTPIGQLNPLQVKNIARGLGLPPEAAHDDNVNALLALFTVPNPNRERLATALRVGLPHNVLNAKNHRNEARIVAEAARPASVTIATNMAGRGVDIVLGGTLDIESRWRVMTLQVLARTMEGKAMQVRSRNEEATQKLVERLSPQRLQDLAWLSHVLHRVDELEGTKAVEGQVAKELRDTLGQDLATPDLKNKVRSRTRRLNLLEQLPLDADPMQDDAVLQSLNADMQRLMNRTFDVAALREALNTGIAARATGRDAGEVALLAALGRPLELARNAGEQLLDVLQEATDLDAALLDAAEASGAENASAFDAESLAQSIGFVTAEWVTARLKELKVSDAASATEKRAALSGGDIEVNEVQLLDAMGEASLGTQWLRERLSEWNLLKDPRAFAATEEMQLLLGDNAVVHGRLDKAMAERLRDEWQRNPEHRRAMITVEAPNLILLGDIAETAGHQADFLHPEWLHQTIAGLGIIGQEDVMQAQMVGQAEDEQGNVQEVPIDVLVYRIRLNRVLDALEPTLREAVVRSESRDAAKVLQETVRHAPWAEGFIDEEWVTSKLQNMGDAAPEVSAPGAALVFIETGVAGQSADIVLESEPRPEDIAHTSEGEEVRSLGGLHILGTERHESRRIDNQLRGRAGRQGDPGSSRFYVSLEDELWRLFGVRGQWLLNKWEEDEAVEAGMISKSIERAQKKVELNHFESRKHVLQYDDVMNVQREVIYRERRRALLGGDLRDTVLDMAQKAALAEADKHCPREVRPEEWDAHKLVLGLNRLFGAALIGKNLKSAELEEMRDRDDIDARLQEAVAACYAEREEQLGHEHMRVIERWQVTRSIDDYWMEHLAEMDYLREAIWQEGYAQKEPIGVYRQEGFALFQKMLGEIRREVTEALFGSQFDPQAEQAMFDQSFYGGPELMDMQEARLLPPLPMDEDGMDDGVMLDKDADGDDDDNPIVTPTSFGGFGAAALGVGASGTAASGAKSGATQAPSRSPRTTGNGSRSGNGASGNGGNRNSGNGGFTGAASDLNFGSAPQDITRPAAKVGRNHPCPCGSGKKYKNCCEAKDNAAGA